MSQLQALVGLRWRMVRSRRSRTGLLGLASLLPVLLTVAVVVGQALPPGERLGDLLLLAPTVFVLFAVLAAAAPLVAGGGNELFPEEQLIAYPMTPRTVFQSGLLMSPLNLAWAMQLLVLFGVTGATAGRGPGVLLAVVTTCTYVAFTTVMGQATAWLVVGARQTRRGRLVCRALGVALAVVVLIMVGTGSVTQVLDQAPTAAVVSAAIHGSVGVYDDWFAVTSFLACLTWGCAWLGVRACTWALRRTTQYGRPELALVRRRAARRSHLAELIAVDQASVWRSTPLRRGLLVLALLPGSVAMLADPTWSSITLLPGLVAAGAGLLFGVNTFCLDGGGALFVASQPHDAQATLRAKLTVVAQTCFVAVVIAVALAATQVREGPAVPELVALIGSMGGATLLVVARCGRLSVESPHKADLRGPRDTPAPPATMAVYSMRLALTTTWASLAFAGAGASGSLTASLAACVAVLTLAARSIVRTQTSWRNPAVRARVVTTVAFG